MQPPTTLFLFLRRVHIFLSSHIRDRRHRCLSKKACQILCSTTGFPYAEVVPFCITELAALQDADHNAASCSAHRGSIFWSLSC